jgi:hypothetical protein
MNANRFLPAGRPANPEERPGRSNIPRLRAGLTSIPASGTAQPFHL